MHTSLMSTLILQTKQFQQTSYRQCMCKPKIALNNAPLIIVIPHPPQVWQQVGICRGFVTKICPQGRGICKTTLKVLNCDYFECLSLVILKLYKGTHSFKWTKTKLVTIFSSIIISNHNSNKIFAFPHLIATRGIIVDL